MKRFYRAAMSALAVAAILIGAVSCNEDVSLQGGIDDILLSRHSLSLTVGGEYELTYRILPEDAETDSLAVWSSEDESVVTVEAGLVTAVGTGTAGIVLEIAGKTDRCEVTVSDIQIDSIILRDLCPPSDRRHRAAGGSCKSGGCSVRSEVELRQ